MRAAASLMELTSMVEVVVRNALDAQLMSWARERRGGASWLDVAPVGPRARDDIRRARDRATRDGSRAEVHGRVIAELSLGFWRYLVESRYLTSLWVPATHRACPHGAADLRTRQRDVAFRLQQLTFVRNRAAHHEPVHQRDIARDLRSAIELADWISPAAGRWVRVTNSSAAAIAAKPERSRRTAVREKGLEPSRREAQEPKSCVSASFTTPAARAGRGYDNSSSTRGATSVP